MHAFAEGRAIGTGKGGARGAIVKVAVHSLAIRSVGMHRSGTTISDTLEACCLERALDSRPLSAMYLLYSMLVRIEQ
ncbi:hypothetical protein MGYG_08191 [Nannizzia gypsea CBS 118893]|uniref:Uncharacterized protein n=1 Tax=Arthroderma gypseum (strain ATCC MYA-4604 / CBS 118893) TaxID=535722 RepID=E4V5A3_ARTGP|nr:hypothetical protein MGYG_08191 [Nannizzia gypsea CBS 118893]EFR05177.1 hypothetical protein MGYG_08191 [Nannizzia gypsea CBS 118893]